MRLAEYSAVHDKQRTRRARLPARVCTPAYHDATSVTRRVRMLVPSAAMPV